MTRIKTAKERMLEARDKCAEEGVKTDDYPCCADHFKEAIHEAMLDAARAMQRHIGRIQDTREKEIAIIHGISTKEVLRAATSQSTKEVEP